MGRLAAVERGVRGHRDRIARREAVNDGRPHAAAGGATAADELVHAVDREVLLQWRAIETTGLELCDDRIARFRSQLGDDVILPGWAVQQPGVLRAPGRAVERRMIGVPV